MRKREAVARGNVGRTVSNPEPLTGAAWLSSARVVRCRVKSHNERNPCLQLPTRNGGDSGETAGVKPEEGGDDVKSSWPLCPVCTRATMAYTKGRNCASMSKTQKIRLSSDRRLQLAFVKLESLVIAGQQHRGECVPESCTHRPSSHEREGGAKSPCQP